MARPALVAVLILSLMRVRIGMQEERMREVFQTRVQMETTVSMVATSEKMTQPL